MSKYRKKPVVIEAVQWTGRNVHDVVSFMANGGRTFELRGAALYIHTLEGTHEAKPGDFIIKGVHGEFYPCDPEIFAETYEEVTDEG